MVREAIIAACLTAVMILLFLGSWRSTLIIAVSIPLSILTSIIVLSALGETINIMTLGGLALAVGILVDDATVTIENIERYIWNRASRSKRRSSRRRADCRARVGLHPCHLHRLPAHVLPQRRRAISVRAAGRSGGVRHARLLYAVAHPGADPGQVPAASATAGPRAQATHRRNPFVRFQHGFEHAFERLRDGYDGHSAALPEHRLRFCSLVPSGVCLSAFCCCPGSARTFPRGRHRPVQAAPARPDRDPHRGDGAPLRFGRRRHPPRDPASELGHSSTTSACRISSINLTYSNSAPIGSEDADILVGLKEDHRPTADYVRALRRALPQEFPGVTFSFLPADMVSQILNFGLPAPIDIQVSGRNVDANRQFVNRLLPQLRTVPGTADLRIQQAFDHPKFHIEVDRTKAPKADSRARYRAKPAVGSAAVSRRAHASGLNPQTVSNTRWCADSPVPRSRSCRICRASPSTAAAGAQPEILADVASIERGEGWVSFQHYNIQRVIDIYGAVQDRDLGAVGRGHERIIDKNRSALPRGAQIQVRGQLETMQDPYKGLLGGLVFSIVLVYLLIVVNFQSWLDPFIIITALPGGAGRHRAVPVLDAHDTQRSRADGRHHVHGRGHGEQHPGGLVRQGRLDDRA